MKGLRETLRELLGLFVDDGSLALALLAWTAVAGLALPRLGLPMGLAAPSLFLGYLVILLENLARTARRKRG
jgi:hypothetical protein